MHNVQVVLPPTLNINFKFVSINHFLLFHKRELCKNNIFIILKYAV